MFDDIAASATPKPTGNIIHIDKGDDDTVKFEIEGVAFPKNSRVISNDMLWFNTNEGTYDKETRAAKDKNNGWIYTYKQAAK